MGLGQGWPLAPDQGDLALLVDGLPGHLRVDLRGHFAKHISIKHHLPHLEQTIVVLLANVLSFAVFWVLKLLLFNRLFHETELDEFDEHLTAEESTTSR